MMHTHFYHWHSRAELKPDPAILEPRWDAAAKFAEKASADDICSLLRLVLFPGAEPKFAKHFSDELVKLEPTFPPEKNAEMLRVMAAAGLYSKLEDNDPTNESDAIALGLHAAAFPPGRIQPVCKEVIERAAEYLAAECERVRPASHVRADIEELQTGLQAEDWLSDEKTIKMLGDTVEELSTTMQRVSEENQFMWWIIGKRSPILQARRNEVAPEAYALIAATEAAERVSLLPPAASVEALIEEALAQCGEDNGSEKSLVKFVDAAIAKLGDVQNSSFTFHELTPLASIMAKRRSGDKVDAKALRQLGMPSKSKSSTTGAARQYFRELMFLRAIHELK